MSVRFSQMREAGTSQHSGLIPVYSPTPLIWHELSLLRTDTQAGLLPAGQAHLN